MLWWVVILCLAVMIVFVLLLAFLGVTFAFALQAAALLLGYGRCGDDACFFALVGGLGIPCWFI